MCAYAIEMGSLIGLLLGTRAGLIALSRVGESLDWIFISLLDRHNYYILNVKDTLLI